MKKLITILLITFITIHSQDFTNETKEQRDAHMQWWRDARFGLFIHWGLYSILAGQWDNETGYAEWIRNQAQIPLEEYDKLVAQFNPVKFNAEEFVRMAKDAGMKYIVITSKHHDGFCLFDSKYTDFDVMSTPFKRDIMKELADACHKEGIKICWYYSIMDWHHPDYLPRRDWEKTRSTEGADFSRYIQYMKNELKELLTNYGEISVLWFDGEWESTWNDSLGRDLYNYVRSLQPKIIINNRLSPSRNGLEGFTSSKESAGDFGTPEQQVPATGLPGVDWESCITMNDHWGYNKNDHNWKSVKELLQMLADVASKGGNLLLNIGPTAEGVFPQASVERLKAIGKWMKVNGESIYGTQASPFKKLDWGRCTQTRLPISTAKHGGQEQIENGTRLYLHVFDLPKEGKLVLPGIYNTPIQSYLLADPLKTKLTAVRNEDAIVINLPLKAPDENNSVVVLDVEGKADVNNPPTIKSAFEIFIDKINVHLTTDRENTGIKYTLDGSIPNSASPVAKDSITLTNTATVSARCFRDGMPVSGTTREKFTKVSAEKSINLENVKPGITYKYFEGVWTKLPDFDKLKPISKGTVSNFLISQRRQDENCGFEFNGYIKIPTDDVYEFTTASDDGSKLFIDGKEIVDNDGLHGVIQKNGAIALATGYHKIHLIFFQKSGGLDLKVYIHSNGMNKQEIPHSMLFYE